MTQKVAGSNFGRSALGSNLGQVVLSPVPLSPSSIIWYRSRGGDALRLEGNRTAGVALAMRHRLHWFIHLHVRAHGLRNGDEHLAYTPHDVWHSFTFTLDTSIPGVLERHIPELIGYASS